MNVLILGAGGREHTLAWKIAQSPQCDKLYVAPGNPGTAQVATNISLDPVDFESVAFAVRDKAIDLLVVGPEVPLVKGIRDYFETDGSFPDLGIIGPGRDGAQLEGSKDCAKRFMARHAIPTAAYQTFTKAELPHAKTYLSEIAPPYVLKADGLAAGKGVVILTDLAEAEKELDEMLGAKKFGEASERVVIEQFLDGIELSVFALTDGKSYLLLPEAKDYKRIGEGDTGLNTGGMGAISPVPFADGIFMQKVKDKIIDPTIKGLRKDGIPFIGFLFFGLIKVDGEPYVIEYNTRLGDPETEAVIPRISSDLLPLLTAAAHGRLEGEEIEFDKRHSATVVSVSGGYPGEFSRGKKISGLLNGGEAMVFHAGTMEKNGEILTAGGRVLAITALGSNLEKALEKAYRATGEIRYEGKYMRRDIGRDVM